MKNLLIVDNDPITLNTIVGLLKSQASFFNVYGAANCRDALDMVATLSIDLVITGLHLPEIASFELLAKLERHHPQVCIMVMTDNASPLLRSKVKQRAGAVHFDQALDLGLLIQRIFSELGIAYGGRIRGVSLPSFLQMMELEDSNCTLSITAKGRAGRLFLRKGQPVAAHFGQLTGRLAALQILTWKHVTIDIDYTAPTVEREITKPLMNLIMESGRLIDEEQRQRHDLRKDERFDCHVVVDYDLSDATYHCCLMDISWGGAYIATEQPIEAGRRIIISLASVDRTVSQSFNGLVIRHDRDGIGVKFDALSLRQKQIIGQLLGKTVIAEAAEHAL